MAQIHKQFTTEQIKVLLEAYNQGHLSRGEIEKTLGINKTRFFAIINTVFSQMGCGYDQTSSIVFSFSNRYILPYIQSCRGKRAARKEIRPFNFGYL